MPIPITIVTGFLGAGKTTLLNHLLRAEHGRRIAVLVNDFGDVNVDAQLIASVEPDTIDLANGCICCTLRDDLVDVVQRLLERPEPPEHVVIEASGISDPHAIAGTFRMPALRSAFRVDAVLAVVDATDVTEAHSEAVEELMREHVRAAGLVVLNKIDRASPGQIEVATRWIRTQAPDVPILKATFGRIPMDVAFGQIQQAEDTAPSTHAHHHDESFRTITFRSARPFASLPVVQHALRSLPDGLLRAKGYVYLAAMPERRVVIHVVGRRIDFEPGTPWGDMPPHTELVLIGEADLFGEADVHRHIEAFV